MIGDGQYILQNGNDSLSANTSGLCNISSLDPSPFIHKNVFCGIISNKKARVEKFSESLCKMIEMHPNTMQLCGVKIGGPLVLSFNSIAMACRAWPSMSLQVDKIAVPLQDLAFSEFKPDASVFAISPHCVVCSKLIVLSPVYLKTKSKDSSLLTTSHFLKYLGQFLNKAYVVTKQVLEVLYFGKSFLLKVEHVEAGSEEMISEKRLNETILPYEANDNLSDEVKSLSISEDKKFDSFISSSTPLKSISSTFHNEASGDKADMFSLIQSHCQFSPLGSVYMITTKTEIDIKLQECSKTKSSGTIIPSIAFNDIGGLKKQIQRLKELVIEPASNPEKLKSVGIQPVRGIIIHGNPGTGKSMLARAVATELGGSIYIIDNSKMMNKSLGESEITLNDIFTDALTHSPSVIICDDLDILCPRRNSKQTDIEKKMVAAFLSKLDELNDLNHKCVFVIGTTSFIDSVHPSLRRSGRFEQEIEISILSATERIEILKKILPKFRHSVTESEIERMAKDCHGYVGNDLLAVCKEAGLHALKRNAQGDGTAVINFNDLKFGKDRVSPSPMKEVVIQVPEVYWHDIGGYHSVKEKLKHTVEWPLKHPEAFLRLGIDPPRGILLYGPPGCSKTLTAKALATESGLNFISIKGPEIFSKFVGESERAVRKVFSKARSAAPSIVFIDELDALAIERGKGNSVADRVLTMLLTEMDGIEHRNDVIVVAATNRPDMIDKAFLRPGRIDRILHVPLPDSETRREIFQINFNNKAISDDVDIELLVENTDRFSGAEIRALCNEAGLAALADNMNASAIALRHFQSALTLVKAQTSDEVIKMYQEYEKTLQSNIK